jgi:polyisoprenoid-binding protein YceI
MKKISSVVMAAGFLFILNIQRPPVADTAIVNEPQTVLNEKGKTYKVDVAGSSIGWVGTKPSGKHNGAIKLGNGSMQVKKGKLLSGSFTIDMNTIENKDLQGKGKDGLEGHLKSADFFDVANNPTATFSITGVTAIAPAQKVLMEGATHNIAGNLTMRGVTKNISFPAAIMIDAKTLTAKADFNIDRTMWNITYGADGKVAKEINLTLDIKAAR